jgi:DNA-binding transcriptional LysR family regulator
LFVIVPKRHPFAKRQEIGLAELKDETFVTLKNSTGLRLFLNSIFESAGISPRIAFEAEECNAMAAFVSANLGVAILPNIPSLNSHNIAILKISNPPCRRTIHLLWSNKKYITPPVLKFKNFVGSKLKVM